MVGYIALSYVLARRCVVLSHAYSEEVSTSTGRLVDAIANAELLRSFARTEFARRFLGRYLAEESRLSVRLRVFLLLMRVFHLFPVLCLLHPPLWVAFPDTPPG